MKTAWKIAYAMPKPEPLKKIVPVARVFAKCTWWEFELVILDPEEVGLEAGAARGTEEGAAVTEEEEEEAEEAAPNAKEENRDSPPTALKRPLGATGREDPNMGALMAWEGAAEDCPNDLPRVERAGRRSNKYQAVSATYKDGQMKRAKKQEEQGQWTTFLGPFLGLSLGQGKRTEERSMGNGSIEFNFCT